MDKLIIIIFAMLSLSIANIVCNADNADKKEIENCSTSIRSDASIVEYTPYETGVYLTKYFERFRSEAYFDYKQFTNGWGTKAKNSKEVISLEEGNKRFKKTWSMHYSKLEKDFPNLDKHKTAILTSFSYNTGGIKKNSNLYKLLKNYEKDPNKENLELVCSKMKDYVNASGNPLKGLIKRRSIETNLLILSEKERNQYIKKHILVF